MWTTYIYFKYYTFFYYYYLLTDELGSLDADLLVVDYFFLTNALCTENTCHLIVMKFSSPKAIHHVRLF